MDTAEYLNLMSPDYGMRMMVHGESTLPFPEDEGINIASGFITSISLDKVSTLYTIANDF